MVLVAESWGGDRYSTGRSYAARVQLREIAYDVAADRLYGHIKKRKTRSEFLRFCRYMLTVSTTYSWVSSSKCHAKPCSFGSKTSV